MSLKLGIKRITDSCVSKDDALFYKVEWEECWLHEDVLSSWNELIEDFTNNKKKNDKDKEVNHQSLDTKEGNQSGKSDCFFCVSKHELNYANHTEQSHASKCSSQELTDIINKKNRSSKNCDRSFFLLSPATVKNVPLSKRKEASHVNLEPSITESVKDTGVIVKRSLNDGSTLYVCSKCNESFNKFYLFKLHYNLHTISTELVDDNALSCKTCGKQFTSKDGLGKHSQLHMNFSFKLSKRNLNKQSARPVRKIAPKGKEALSKVTSVDQEMIDLSQMPFDTSETNDLSPELNPVNSDVNVEELLQGISTQPESKSDPSKESSEFSDEVLRNARQYIKSVSRRRKEKTMRRMMGKNIVEEPVKHSIRGIGVDVELKPSEEALPIVTKVGSRYGYSCKVCGKMFYNKFHHREHFNVHSGEMPYECEFCSKRFAQRSGWNRHIKLHHKYHVFQGPIPNRQTDRKEVAKEVRASIMAAAASQSTTASQVVGVSTPIKIVAPIPTTRFVPIAPYPGPIGAFPQTGAIPISPALLSPDRFPNSLETSLSSVLIQAQSGGTSQPNNQQPIAILPDFLANNPPRVIDVVKTGATPKSTVISNASENSNITIGRKSIFQCKKVRSMDGSLIFMIRVTDGSIIDGADDKKTEFAYVLDTASGNVESRIFVSDHPGGNWIDFPLDELANEVLLERIQLYDDKNRRGPKPRHYQIAPTMLREETLKQLLKEEELNTGKENLKKALTVHHAAMEIKHQEGNYPPPTTSNGKPAEDGQLLTTHGRSFRSGKEKRFSCSICSRKFLAQAHLNDHMLIHTGEFPYKCMFCSRPFRHKSGLNSHHKRHIQNGVFDRPISSTKQRREKESQIVRPAPTEIDSSSTTKSKRKGRPPKRMEMKVTVNENLFKIKQEEKEVDIDDMLINDNHQRDNVTFDVQDMFECNFCGMVFPIRTAYLKHVSTVHKNTTPVLSRDEFTDSSGINDDLNSEYIRMSDFENTLLDIEPGSPSNGKQIPDTEFIADIKIKEEMPDY